MKKIECLISEEKMNIIDLICSKEGYTRAELNRRIIDIYINKPSIFFCADSTYFFKCPDCSADITLITENGLPPKINLLKHNS